MRQICEGKCRASRAIVATAAARNCCYPEARRPRDLGRSADLTIIHQRACAKGTVVDAVWRRWGQADPHCDREILAVCAARDDRTKISMLHVLGGVAKTARAAIPRYEF